MQRATSTIQQSAVTVGICDIYAPLDGFVVNGGIKIRL